MGLFSFGTKNKQETVRDSGHFVKDDEAILVVVVVLLIMAMNSKMKRQPTLHHHRSYPSCGFFVWIDKTGS